LRRSWIAWSGGDSFVNTPADLSPPRNSVAWPPTRAAASRISVAGREVTSQRWPPCHSISSSPARPSSGAVGGSDRRQRAPSRCSIASRAATKNSSRWSRRPSQKGVAAATGIGSPPSRRTAASTAAAAPERRSNRLPFHQALASSGNGSPPQACRAASASAGFRSKRSVACASAFGSTLSVASTTMPSVPSEPEITRETS
jgi:hypothetical protein